MAAKRSAGSTERAQNNQAENETAKPSVLKPPPVENKVEVVSWTDDQRPRTDATPAETGEAQESEQPENKMFTQNDIDALIGNRLKRERAERDKLAEELNKTAAELKSYQDAEKTEAEKLTERLTALETENRSLAERNRQMAIDQELAMAANKVQLPVDAALKLVDKDAIELDDNGRVTNADELIKGIVSAYPGLTRSQPAQAPAVNSSRSEQTSQSSEQEMRHRLFGSGGGDFWKSGGVLMPSDDE